MIPKTIHYCWFGRNPKPKFAKKCMKSWKKYCPDYEIIEWNESNFDISKAPLYVRQAYEAKKWAYVTDYVRLWAVYNYGGVYFDTDVEIIKSIDCLLDCDSFWGFESEKYVATGLGFGAICKSQVVFKMMSDYDDLLFLLADGNYNTTPCPQINSHVFEEYGARLDNTYQKFDDFTLFPSDYFCPKDWYTGLTNITDNTYTIHHFDASWRSIEENKEYNAIQKKYEKERKVKKVLHFRKKVLRRIFGEEFYSKHLKWKGKI